MISLIRIFCLSLVLALTGALDNGLGLVPPMGWNSWNCIGGNVNEAYVRAIADGLVSSGLTAKGYRYVNLDDGVMLVNRSATGQLQPDPSKFTNGSLKPLADYLHGKGLLLGVYTCAGTKTCMGRAGSHGHEVEDAALFAQWGVDYVKVDWCYNVIPAVKAYPVMRDALNQTGRPMFFKMCEWGDEDVWKWGKGVANSWRTWNDICNYWFTNHTENPYCSGVYDVIEQNEQYWQFAGPGGWNDPCYLVTGNQYMSPSGLNMTMSATQFRSQFALWAMMASPLILSADVRAGHMTGLQMDILGNEELIAVNQDRLGVQGHIIDRQGVANELHVWTKALADGSVAIALYNHGNSSAANISVSWSQVTGLSPVWAECRDLWLHAELGTLQSGITRRVIPHETFVFRCHNATN